MERCRVKPLSLLIPLPLLLALLSTFVLGASPFNVQSSSASAWAISHPQHDTYRLGTNATLYFHVFNQSGYMLTRSQANCTIHIYAANGSHLVDAAVPPDDNNLDYEYNLTSDGFIMNNEANYPFIVWCNSTDNKGGFVSTAFSVTRGGEAVLSNVDRNPVAVNLWLLTLTLVFAFCAALFYHARHPLVFLFVLLTATMMMFSTWINREMMREAAYPFSAPMLAMFLGFGLIFFFILAVITLEMQKWALELKDKKRGESEQARFGYNEKK